MARVAHSESELREGRSQRNLMPPQNSSDRQARAPSFEADQVNAFSVDVEDYYQVAAFERVVPRHRWEEYEPRVVDNTRRLLDLFDKHGVQATFFVLGWVAERRPQLVREVHRAGHEVASHGYDHRRVTEQTPDEFRDDVRRTKHLLEDLSGAEVIGYRAPNYSIVERTLWALDIVLEEGHGYDSSIFPILHDRYGIPGAQRFPWLARTQDGASLYEFPISTIRVAGVSLPFVGGGYLRHFPWRFVRWGMRRLNLREHQPAMVYIHPWEIDPEQPRQPAGMLNSIRHYRNLARTEERLGRLFREFRFTTARSVLGL